MGVEENDLPQCMFCLENVDDGGKLRPCRCTLYYHDACYLSWVESYGTICPLCRKAPVPHVNPNTLELEFELVENPMHIIAAAPPPLEHHSLVAESVALATRQNRILAAIWLSMGSLLILFLLISLRTYNVI